MEKHLQVLAFPGFDLHHLYSLRYLLLRIPPLAADS